MLRVADLDFAYGAGFSMTVPALELTGRAALVGSSGAGKTTLLHLLAGILAPRAGTVVVDDVTVGALGEAACRRWRMSRVGLVFQDFELLAHLSVEENVLLPYLIGGGPSMDEAVRPRALALLERAGIARYRTTRPEGLSQGERQRVAVCRALLTEPALLLADEPTANLDPDTADVILEMLLGAPGTVLVATHDHRLLPRFERVVDLAELAA